jgi:hypothetical protein
MQNKLAQSKVASEFSRTKTIAIPEQGAASNNNPILKWNVSHQYVASFNNIEKHVYGQTSFNMLMTH